MQKHSSLPTALIASFWRNKSLIKLLTQREIMSRYKGSFFGVAWSFITPLLMLLVYTFVFGSVFKVRWSSTSDSKIEFALMLFAGLMVFNIFADGVGKSPSLILQNSNYVKKVVFPLDALIWVNLGAALFHFGISLLVWLTVYIFCIGQPAASALYVPVVILPVVLLTLGLSWLFSALGVYLRDVAQFVGLLISVLMFMSPIFYPLSSLPAEYQALLALNPISPVVEMMRTVLYLGEAPSLSLWLNSMAISAALAYMGFVWFQKTRNGFSDVL
jgi:lipopolysaccharide transport system permease protein